MELQREANLIIRKKINKFNVSSRHRSSLLKNSHTSSVIHFSETSKQRRKEAVKRKELIENEELTKKFIMAHKVEINKCHVKNSL